MTKKSKKIKSKKIKSKKSNVVMADQTGYCVSCKAKKVIENAKKVMVGKDKDRPALKGVCPDCGTTVMRFLKRDAA